MDTNEPKNEVELKAWVEDLCRRSRHERGAWDDTIAQLRAQIDGPLASAARHVIEEVARKEPLEFQWRIETMLEETAPPEPPAPEPEEEPEPKARQTANEPEARPAKRSREEGRPDTTQPNSPPHPWRQ